MIIIVIIMVIIIIIIILDFLEIDCLLGYSQ